MHTLCYNHSTMKTQLIAKIDAQRDNIIALHNKYLELEPQAHTQWDWCQDFGQAIEDMFELQSQDDGIFNDEEHEEAWQYIFQNLPLWVA